MTSNSLVVRRHQLTEFRDLFTALFKIPDREVQTRVLDAINGIVNPIANGSTVKECSCKKSKKFVDFGTQTIAIVKTFKRDQSSSASEKPTAEAAYSKGKKESPWPDSIARCQMDTGNSEAVCPKSIEPQMSVKSSLPRPLLFKAMVAQPEKQQPAPIRQVKIDNTKSFSDFLDGKELKRRRRTVKVPRVEKVTTDLSRARFLFDESSQDSQQSCSLKRKFSSSLLPKSNRPPLELETGKLVANLIDCCSPEEIVNGIKSLESPKNVIETMKQEWVNSTVVIEGLLPIHTAILGNNIQQLKRQIYVLKFRKINVHKLLTDNDEAPLQLAIKNDCTLDIINELIVNDADTNEVDKDSNTVIHLAMKCCTNTKLLRLLLERINFDILKLFNDDGNTALHVGILEKKLLMCKTLLEFIDEKEKMKTIGFGISDRETLLRIYKNELQAFLTKDATAINPNKEIILNAKNRKDGRTPLFYALENRTEESEVTVLMLLVHLADPKISDFTEMDSIAFVMDTYEVNRYNDALEISTLYLDKCLESAARIKA